MQRALVVVFALLRHLRKPAVQVDQLPHVEQLLLLQKSVGRLELALRLGLLAHALEKLGPVVACASVLGMSVEKELQMQASLLFLTLIQIDRSESEVAIFFLRRGFGRCSRDRLARGAIGRGSLGFLGRRGNGRRVTWRGEGRLAPQAREDYQAKRPRPHIHLEGPAHDSPCLLSSETLRTLT